ncbi:MAG: prepilin-type N-terminal cleavage/methylation domain-containing protein [Alphaproteobacteria bacterium]|nr:prepilin-type N-terminal cleavage/methylation domain-containing protein [Alphaproteobacteria bacterium]
MIRRVRQQATERNRLQAADRRRRGFTLFEMLVSLVVLSLTMGLVALSVGVMSDGWGRGGTAAEIHEMVGRANDVLSRDFKSLRRIVVDRQTKPRFVFAGTPVAITYVVREPPYPTEPGLYIVRLSIDRRSDGTERLMRSRIPYHPDRIATTLAGTGPLRDSVPLIEGNLGVQFGYSADGTTWQPGWNDTRRNPQLIRVRVQGKGSTRVPTDLVLRLAIDAEADCTGTSGPCTIKSDGRLQEAAQAPEEKPQPSAKPSADAATGSERRGGER